MLPACFAGFVIDFDRLLLTGSSLSLAVITIFALAKFRFSTKVKIGLIYSHLFFLFFPFVLLTTNATVCGFTCLPCTNNLINLAVLALPTTFIFSTAAGFFVVPAFHMYFNRKAETENVHIIRFTKTQSARLNVKMPKIYITDTVNPTAFSFRSFKPLIFISAGLVDLLRKKEMEAVILHELGHLKRRASVLKMSFSLVRFFSPFSLITKFHRDMNKEEIYADMFVVRTQKTSKYLRSAKRKIENFERFQHKNA